MSDDPEKLADDMEVPVSALAAPEITDAAKVAAYKSALTSAPAKTPTWYDKLPALKPASAGTELGKGLADMFANQAAATAKLSAAEPLRRFKNKQKDANRAALMAGVAGMAGKLLDRPQQQAAAELEMAKFRGAQQMADRKMSNEETQTTDARDAKAAELTFKREVEERAGKEFAEKLGLDYSKLTQEEKQHAAEMGFKDKQLAQNAADNKAQRGLGYAQLGESKRAHDMSNAEAIRAHDLNAAQQKAESEARLAAAAAARGEKLEAKNDTFTTAYAKDTADDVKLLTAISKMRDLDNKYAKKGEKAPGTGAPILERPLAAIRDVAGFVGVKPSEEGLDAEQRKLLSETIKSGQLRAESGANYTLNEEQSAALRTGASENATAEQRAMALQVLEDATRGRLRTRGTANPAAARATIKESGLDPSQIWTTVKVTSPDGKLSQDIPVAKAAIMKSKGWSVEE